VTQVTKRIRRCAFSLALTAIGVLAYGTSTGRSQPVMPVMSPPGVWPNSRHAAAAPTANDEIASSSLAHLAAGHSFGASGYGGATNQAHFRAMTQAGSMPHSGSAASWSASGGAGHPHWAGPESAQAEWMGAVPAAEGRTFHGGADLLLVRPTFSEAIAFARGTQTFPVSLSTRAVPIEFDYEASYRAFVGMRNGESGAGWRFTYTSITADTQVNGTAGGAGQFIVDPFGNLVGSVQVVDPADARGIGTVVSQGPFVADAIRTFTSVDLRVYDIDFMSPMGVTCHGFTWSYQAGLRFADVQQFYESAVDVGGVNIARGDFDVDFFGVGPHVGINGERQFGGGRVSLFGSLSGSLLVGNHDVVFSNSPLPGVSFTQEEVARRTIPVLESELGVRVRAFQSCTLTAGWLFQSWWDLGASGGTFGGWFSGADDSNIMSFDGLFLRAEFGY
jgi:hypothetical protein